MADKSNAIRYCVGDPDLHVKGICSVIEATIGWNYPNVIRILHSQFTQGTRIALDGDKVVGRLIGQFMVLCRFEFIF